jgi:hypothetical protein
VLTGSVAIELKTNPWLPIRVKTQWYSSRRSR